MSDKIKDLSSLAMLKKYSAKDELEFAQMLQFLSLPDVEKAKRSIQTDAVCDFREDIAHDSLLQETVLQGAPSTSGEYISVPRALGEEL